MTLVTRSLASALGITLALSLLGGQIALLFEQLGQAGVWVARVFPNKGLEALTLLTSSSPPAYGAADWAWISANLIGWAALSVVVSVATFRRLDILAASD